MNRLPYSSLIASAIAVLVMIGTTVSVTAQTNFYVDRPSFETDFPGLPLEDFEEAPVPPGGSIQCSDVVNSSTSDACFRPGEIIPDVDFTYGGGGPGNQTATLGVGFMGPYQTSIAWGPESLPDALIITFTGHTFAAGMDVYRPFKSGEVNVTVLGTGGEFLGSTVLPLTPITFAFMGVESSSLLGSIILDAGGPEAIDNFSMSEAPIVATEPLGNEQLPDGWVLEQAYPNPFNPATSIRFSLPELAQVRLVVYDVLGRPIRVLFDGVKAEGTHEVAFDADGLPSGAYLYRLETPERSLVGRMLLAK